MVKDRIRDGLIDKAAEATGMDPQLVRFALGRFEQGQAAKKVAANRVSTTVAGVAAVGVSVMLPMAAPMLGPIMSRVGGTVAQSLLTSTVAASGTIGVMGARTVIAANTYNNPLTQAVVGMGGAITGTSGLVQSSNRLNELKQQERGLIQDAVGSTVASAMGLPPDAAQCCTIKIF